MILDKFRRRYILKGKPIDSKEWEVLAEYPQKVNWIDVKEELEDQLGVEYQCFRLDECKPNGAVIRPVWTKCKRKSKKKIILTEDDFEKFNKLHEFIGKMYPKADPAQILVSEMERIALLKSYAEYINKVFGGNSGSDDWLLQMIMNMFMQRGMSTNVPLPTQPLPQAPIPQPQQVSNQSAIVMAPNLPQEQSNDTIVVKNEEIAKIIDEEYRKVEEAIGNNAPCKEIGACEGEE